MCKDSLIGPVLVEIRHILPRASRNRLEIAMSITYQMRQRNDEPTSPPTSFNLIRCLHIPVSHTLLTWLAIREVQIEVHPFLSPTKDTHSVVARPGSAPSFEYATTHRPTSLLLYIIYVYGLGKGLHNV